MERKNLGTENCPVARSLDLIGGWWTLMIIREAFNGVTRFDDFQRNLGISRNSLTDRLKTLVEGGIFLRRPVAEGARREEYVLTEKGEDLLAVMVALRQWGDKWMFEPGKAPATMIEATTGKPIKEVRVESADGRALERAEITLKMNDGHAL